MHVHDSHSHSRGLRKGRRKGGGIQEKPKKEGPPGEATWKSIWVLQHAAKPLDELDTRSRMHMDMDMHFLRAPMQF